MKNSRTIGLWYGCFCVLCAAALLLSVARLAAPQILPGSEAQSVPVVYTVRDKGGKVAVYTLDTTGAEQEQAVYDIYVNLLPEQDVLRLRQGIGVPSEEALQKLLEDLGG